MNKRIISTDPTMRQKHREAQAAEDDKRARWQKQAAMVKAVLKTRGLIGLACRQCDISERTHRDWMLRYPKYATRIKESILVGQDMIEFRLIEKCDEGDVTALRVYLSARCKDRGYGVQRSEVTGPNGSSVSISNSPTLEELMTRTNNSALAGMVGRVKKGAAAEDEEGD